MEQADRIEAEYKTYHANVAAIQLCAQESKEQIRQDNRMELDHYIDSHLEESVEEVTEKFAKILDVDILSVRQHMANTIQIEREKLQVRLDKIMKHQ